MSKVAKLLIIAGSDSGGGAGIQADIKAASAMGVYSATAITAITAQNTVGVQAVEPVSPAMVTAQIRSVLDDIAVDAVKIGMLGGAPVIRAVAEALEGFVGPVVLDPVMIAKSGDALLDPDAIEALRDFLPRATLLTPNLPEAACLLGHTAIATGSDCSFAQGRALLRLGPGAVLMKGGHAAGPVCRDQLVMHDALHCFEADRIHTANTHGTGCSLASAIAAGLARGLALPDAVGRAHGWLHGAILASDRLHVGQGHGPVHHFHEVWA